MSVALESSYAVAESRTLGGRALLISDHDYRTARRANMHPIADALARLGCEVCFVSVRFSALSRLKGDSRNFPVGPRQPAGNPAMACECYLWKTPFHPFHPRIPIANDVTHWPIRLTRISRMPVSRRRDASGRPSSSLSSPSLGALLMQRAPRPQSIGHRSSMWRPTNLRPSACILSCRPQPEAAIGDIDSGLRAVAPRLAPRFEWARRPPVLCAARPERMPTFPTTSRSPVRAPAQCGLGRLDAVRPHECSRRPRRPCRTCSSM